MEKVFDEFLALLDFLTKLHLRVFFVAYRPEFTTDPNKENMSY